MAEQKLITWTIKAKNIYKELMNGKKKSEIAKSLSTSRPYVTKINNAIKSGQHPPVEKQGKTPKQKTPKVQTVNPDEQMLDTGEQTVDSNEQISQPGKQNVSTGEQNQNTGSEQNQGNNQKGQQQQYRVGDPAYLDSTIARVIPQPVIMPLTPIMYSAKAYLIQRRGWAENVRWEDIIDTIFSSYFKSIGVVLRGWYEEDIQSPLKPASVEDKGNGHKQQQAAPDALKQLSDMVTMQIIQLANEGSLGKPK